MVVIGHGQIASNPLKSDISRLQYWAFITSTLLSQSLKNVWFNLTHALLENYYRVYQRNRYTCSIADSNSMLSNVQFILICGIRIASRDSQKKEWSKLTHRQLRNRRFKWMGAFCPARIWLEKDKMWAFRGPWLAQKIFSWMPEWLIRSAEPLIILLGQNYSQVRWNCCSLLPLLAPLL